MMCIYCGVFDTTGLSKLEIKEHTKKCVDKFVSDMNNKRVPIYKGVDVMPKTINKNDAMKLISDKLREVKHKYEIKNVKFASSHEGDLIIAVILKKTKIAQTNATALVLSNNLKNKAYPNWAYM